MLRRAFHDLLFGIPLQSDMRFRFDYAGMHLRADAVSVDGAEFAFGWHRRGGRVFPDAAGDPSASRWLAELLAAVSPRQVEMLFALDTERLRSGGRELATGDSTLGSALLSGTGELASARALRRSLDDRRSAIWERGKSSRPLNAALSRLSAAARQRREAVQTPRSLVALQGELAEAGALKHATAARGEAAQAQLSRLNRIELTRAPLAILAEAEAWLAAHRDALVLPEGLGEALVRARHEASLAATRRDTLVAQRADAEARAAAAVRDPAADAMETELARLAGLLGDATTKRADSAARRTERAEALAHVAAALRDIGLAVPADQAGTVIPTLVDMEAARERISQHGAASTTVALAQARLDTAREAVDLLQSAAAAATVVAPDGLAASLAGIRRSRDPLDHAAELAQATRQAMAAERACLANLPGWTGSAADLLGLQPQTEDSYGRLSQVVAEAERALAAATTECRRLQAQRSQWEAALATLRQTALPDEAALAGARAERDRGWRLIYARAFAGSPDEAGERAYGGSDALPMAFERHLRAADAVADARLGELGRIEQAALLSADLAGSQPAWTASVEAVAGAGQRHRDAVAQWGAACRALRLPPDATLRDVAALLTARRDAIEARQATELSQGAQAELAAQHADWAACLAGLLAVPGTLATLLPLADARLQAADTALKDTLARDAQRAQADAELRAATAALAAAEQGLARWQTGWGETLRLLRRPPGETPAVTGRVLGRLAEMDRHHRTAAGLQGRIDDMQADIASFTATVASLAARLGLAAGADAFTTAEALIARRDAARRLGVIAAEALQALALARQQADEASRQSLDAAAAVAAIVAGCGAGDAETAERQIAAARERARQEAARDTAEARLREIGAGASFKSLAAEVDMLPQDEFDAARRQAESALTGARQEEQAAAIRLAELERRYAADAVATGAAEAAEGEAAIAAEAGRLLDEYLLLRVSSGMLGRALDRVEESAGPTGVQRIARAFEAVTGGAWTIRAGENARGETLLLASEPAANEPAKQIDQLSEGTRDQLYLALRLVAIESHVADRPALAVHRRRHPADLRRHPRTRRHGGADRAEPARPGHRADPPSASAGSGGRPAGARPAPVTLTSRARAATRPAAGRHRASSQAAPGGRPWPGPAAPGRAANPRRWPP